MKKIIAIVQARMGSSRLPNKVMKKISGVPMIEILLSRLAKSQLISKIILATSDDPKNKELIDHVIDIGFEVFVGSEHDVLNRYYECAKKYKADTVIRITGDCPLVDYRLVDLCINEFNSSFVDYLSNVDPPTYPDGLDIEVFKFKALEKANQSGKNPLDREHVTKFIRESKEFDKGLIKSKIDYSFLRWTVDEEKDLNLIKSIFENFHDDIHFAWEDVIALWKNNPKLFDLNISTQRNEGLHMGKGQKLWKRAKEIIPGGNMLLSKRSEMFLPDLWPSYFSKAKGCKVWDLDGKEYLDMSIMGIGTNILGYGHPDVDLAVKANIDNGNMSTLNCPEEVFLAEKLIEIHPWAQMVKLARSGGEANAIAIRIARAASGKEKVAICGYHGWHDWYLAANLGGDKSLDGHLLPGLEPNGVPRNLRNTIYPFEYNNFEQLEKLVELEGIGVIKMEVSRNKGPENQFLEKVRKLATEKNIVLIFDECTSGFRQSFGGLHKIFNVEPDMAMFGKALGNGYAITAIIGKKEVMEAAQTTFISSTFWTERIGPTAALKTLEVMERINSWDYITSTGLTIRDYWKKLALEFNLEIELWGLPALSGFTIKSNQALQYKTLITQEMLQKGYLASNSIYVCIDHTEKIIQDYIDNLRPVFKLISQCEDGMDINQLLNGPVCHAGFKRLN